MQTSHVKAWLSLHESTRRALCKFVFMIGGILPLVTALMVSGLQFLPSYHQWQVSRWESWISAHCGLLVQVSAVEQLAPNLTKLHGIRFNHPESNHLRGRIHRIEIKSNVGRYDIRIVDAATQLQHLREVWRSCHDDYLCKVDSDWPTINLEIEGLSLRGLDSDGDRFCQATAHIAPTIRGARGMIRFGGKGPIESESLVLEIQRCRDEGQLTTKVNIQTGRQYLPTRLVSQFIPDIHVLGNATEFSGDATWASGEDSWQLHLRNASIRELDLGQWTSQLATPITGRGRMYIIEADFCEHGVRSAKGSLYADSGKISQALLSKGLKYLQFVAKPELHFANVSMQSYDALGLDFDISASGLKFSGNLASTATNMSMHPGTFMADKTGNLAGTSSDKPFRFDWLLAVMEAAGGQGQTVELEGVNLPTGGDGWRIARWLPMKQSETDHANSQPAEIRLSRSH